ncbi:MAG TPA: IgGFc-binding protein [Myxococcota bacterium]|nr:IgGFc-binding protein [Myxococcota bacterium]HQK51479.1 IgGFc-binding protein [Myxococcota bacterium]
MRRGWLVLGTFWVACGNGGGGNGADSRGPEDVGSADGPPDAAAEATDERPGEFPVCVPGTRLQCSDDARGEVVCNAEGTGYTVRACTGDSICQDPAVGCTSCIPGRLSCLNDETVVRCDATGSRWEVAQDCAPETTGKVCRNGVCIGLCELADKLSSYIGCEYWGVDLDNAMVSAGEGNYLDAAGSQFAIVVSNPSDRFPATVQIFTAFGEVLHDSRCNPLPRDPIPPLGLRVFNLPRFFPTDGCEPCTNGPGETYPGSACTQTFQMDVDLTSLKPQAFRVKSSIPITAYQFNPLENVGVYSNDASILLPTNALGKAYLVMTREQTFQDLKGFLTVVAVDRNETQVYVQVTAPTVSAPTLSGRTWNGDAIPAMAPGESRTFTLQQYDVLNIETNAYGADLTGSVVYANHPVAVFGGSEASNAPNTNHCCPLGGCQGYQDWMSCAQGGCVCEWPDRMAIPPRKVSCTDNSGCINYNTCCADHLEMQMFPVKTWGLQYVVSRSYPRKDEKDSIRLMAAQDDTRVTTYPLQGEGTYVLNRGEWVDFESNEDFQVRANRPVLVGQFLQAQDAPNPNQGLKDPADAGTGDPSFLLAVPIEQFRTEYVFLTPDKYRFDAVNLIVETGEPVWLDGQEVRPENLTFRPARDILQQMASQDPPLDHPWQLGPTFGQYAVIGDGTWSVFRVVLKDGVHRAQCAKPFGAIVYGYDRYVSYGYPAGLNLEDLKIVQEEPPAP